MKEAENPDNQELPLSVLKLFPRRQQPEELTLDQISKIFEVVCCPFCLALIQNPVFLRCGHRFCRECIDSPKITDKKMCPICPTETKTKNKYKEDPQINRFVQSIFGKAEDWRKEQAELKKKQLEQFKVAKTTKRTSKKQTNMDIETSNNTLVTANIPAKEEKDLKKKKVNTPIPIEPQPAFSIPIEQQNLNRSTKYISQLKTKYGVQIERKIASEVGILFHLYLRKIEEDPLTRPLEKSGLQTLTKATVRNIVTYIARQLNLPDDPSFIKLFIRKDQHHHKSNPTPSPPNYIELTQLSLTLGEINDTFWPHIRNDFSIFTMSDLLTSIHESSRIKIPDRRVIYYRLFFQQLSL